MRTHGLAWPRIARLGKPAGSSRDGHFSGGLPNFHARNFYGVRHEPPLSLSLSLSLSVSLARPLYPLLTHSRFIAESHARRRPLHLFLSLSLPFRESLINASQIET